jgi:hypothetical protein
MTGLLTSTFSGLFVLFGSGRAGRDVPLSWVEVATNEKSMLAARDTA